MFKTGDLVEVDPSHWDFDDGTIKRIENTIGLPPWKIESILIKPYGNYVTIVGFPTKTTNSFGLIPERFKLFTPTEKGYNINQLTPDQMQRGMMMLLQREVLDIRIDEGEEIAQSILDEMKEKTDKSTNELCLHTCGECDHAHPNAMSPGCQVCGINGNGINLEHEWITPCPDFNAVETDDLSPDEDAEITIRAALLYQAFRTGKTVIDSKMKSEWRNCAEESLRLERIAVDTVLEKLNIAEKERDIAIATEKEYRTLFNAADRCARRQRERAEKAEMEIKKLKKRNEKLRNAIRANWD